MAGIDLREIKFRSFSDGDTNTSKSLFPTAGASTTLVSLAGIKFRSKEDGD